jgi:hypothetical protein
MAGFTRTHGDAQPVFAIDVQNGPVAPDTSANGTTTNLYGPALDFFGFDLGAAPTAQLGVDEMVAQVMVSIEQLATVAIYAVQATANVSCCLSSWRIHSGCTTNTNSCFRYS